MLHNHSITRCQKCYLERKLRETSSQAFLYVRFMRPKKKWNYVLHFRAANYALNRNRALVQPYHLFSNNSLAALIFPLDQNSEIESRNVSLHWSPPHVYWCLCRRDMRENERVHFEQQYFFTAECVCKCARRFERSANARWHLGHW